MAKTISLSDYPLWKNAREKNTLFRMTFELTKRCTNNCIHCYNNLDENDPDAVKRELSTDEVKDIVDQAVDLGLLWITLTGGEIFLRNDFLDLYVYMKKKGLLVSLFSNATLITRTDTDVLKKYPPRDIEISVYGIDKISYAKVARKDNFLKFKTGLDLLKQAGIPFGLKSTVMKANFKQLKEITQFCEIHANDPKKRFRFDPFLVLRTDKNRIRNKEIIRQRLSAEEIIRLEKQYPERVDALCKQYTQINEKKQNMDSPEIIFKCGAGINSCSIDAHGSFKLCSLLVNESCTYNLKTGTFSEAWNTFTPEIRSLTSSKKAYHTQCSICKLRDFCTWCPAIVDLEDDVLDEKNDSFCDTAHKRYKYCFNLNQNKNKN